MGKKVNWPLFIVLLINEIPLAFCIVTIEVLFQEVTKTKVPETFQWAVFLFQGIYTILAIKACEREN